MNKKRGISLITLIITIIVIIILAGAIILSLNNTNIIGNANKAVYDQDRESLIDTYTMLTMDKFVANSTKDEPIGNIDISELYTKIGKDLGDNFKVENNNLLEKQEDGSYDIIAKFPNSGSNGESTPVEKTEEEVTKDWAKTEIKKAYVTNNKKIPVSTAITKNGEKKVVIPVPEGFTVSTVAGETDLGEGVVIYRGNEVVDSNNHATALITRDQFVWVPVDGTSIKYERDTKWLDYLINMEDNELSEFMGVPPEEQTPEMIEEVKYLKSSFIKMKNTLALDTAALPEGFQTEKNIKESVKKYGGFYIGRYEAGSDSIEPRTSASGTADNLLVQKGKNVYNYINYNDSFAKANSFAVTQNNVKCSLVTGEGWDAALKFISKYENGCENYILDSTNKGNYSGSLSVTGDKDYSYCNIYDMAGNTFERISEKAFGEDSSVLRGGVYGISGSIYSAGCYNGDYCSLKFRRIFF